MRKINARLNSSVENAFALLDLIRDLNRPVTAAEISEHLGIAKTTTYSLIRTALNCGYLEREETTGRFWFGYKSYKIALYYQNSFRFDNAVMKLEEFAKEAGLMCSEYILRDNLAVLIRTFAPREGMLSSFPDFEDPAWICAPGRMMLSGLSRHELEDSLSKERLPLTEATVTDRDELLKRIAEAGKQGYCLELGEIKNTQGTLAMPIYSPSGQIIASLNCHFDLGLWKSEGTLLKNRFHKTIEAVRKEIYGSSSMIITG